MLFYCLLSAHCIFVSAYFNSLFKIKSADHDFKEYCGGIKNDSSIIYYKQNKFESNIDLTTPNPNELLDVTFNTVQSALVTEKDPFYSFHKDIYQFIYGSKSDGKVKLKTFIDIPGTDILAHYPSGHDMRSELFMNKSAVHLPMAEFMHRGHCNLRVTKDYMQTAVDAFSIMLYGTIQDILRLPSSYVLHSTRTISMMKIAKENLAATWIVVKGNRRTVEIDIQTLELYRPLFKYINAREMARLNLSDENILYYIGTHAELDRHQVGVVVNRYIHLNPNWREPKYLNLMNNLLCGVPMNFMRNVPQNTYLQLSHQLFYHIQACDPLQRRFYLAFITKTQALGKSYSWNARDVSRLGLLLLEVHENDLSAIKPKAIAGISAQVMLAMPVHKLKSLTKMQISYIESKPFNIYARKIKKYNDIQQLFNIADKIDTDVLFLIIVIKLYF